MSNEELHEHLQQLGSGTQYVYEKPDASILEVFENPHPLNKYDVDLGFLEFTSLCPKTGQPDFADIHIVYMPRTYCIETKSLKLYLFSFRQHGAFMEDIVNTICNDLDSVLSPLYLNVSGEFNARGGITLDVNVSIDRR